MTVDSENRGGVKFLCHLYFLQYFHLKGYCTDVKVDDRKSNVLMSHPTYIHSVKR